MSALLRHYAKIDARSLGLFRVLFGLTLLGDLRYRWGYLTDFYSNDGVLPNHNHLYNLKTEGRFVWSGLHAFNSPGEAFVGFAVIALFYALFTVGYKTRVFHALSVVSLISLVARNLLTEGAGDAVALALLTLTFFLPLGSRFSVDALLAGSKDAQETKPQHLLDRHNLPSEALIQAARRPGWSPLSATPALVLSFIAVLFFSFARDQSGAAWQDGTALRKALHVFMFASPLGFSVRDSGLLTGVTYVLHLSQYAVPALLVIPVLRGLSRGVAALLIVCYGLVYALLTSHALFGFAIASSAALVIANDTWSTWASKHDPRAVRTVIFDGDCGICFWLSKMLRRLDTRRHLVFQSNDAVVPSDEAGEGEADSEGRLLTWDDNKKELVRKAAPAGLTAKLLNETVVVVRPDGTYATRGQAVAEALRAIPGGGPLATLLSLPLLSSLRDAAYDVVAARRTRISTELGFAACGVPVKGDPSTPVVPGLSPASAARFGVASAFREMGALLLFAAILAQAGETHALGFKIPHNKALDGITWWSRNTTAWALMSPEPPATKGGMIVDAVTKDGVAVDPLTGAPPTDSIERPFPLGAMWASYLDRIQRDEYRGYQNSFKTYVAKRGPRFSGADPNQRLLGIDAYWVVTPTLAEPGSTPEARRLFRQGKGGERLNTKLNAAAVVTPAEPRGPLPTLLRPEPGLDDDPPPPPPANNFSPGLQ